jgi:hypothetical protein
VRTLPEGTTRLARATAVLAHFVRVEAHDDRFLVAAERRRR